MTNDYFTWSNTFSPITSARSGSVDAAFQAVEAAFDKLPSRDGLNQGRTTHVADTGAADVYAVTLSPAPVGYVTGLMVQVLFSATNTGACTVNVNGLGARAIKLQNGANPNAGDLRAGDIHQLIFDGTNFVLGTPTRQVINAAAQGIGGVGGLDSPVCPDLDDTTLVQGFYRVDGSTANKPSGVSFGILVVYRYNIATFGQTIIINPGTIKSRYYGGSFSAWRDLIDDTTLEAEVDALIRLQDSLTIEDDAVATITPPQTAGFMDFVRGGNGDNASFPDSGSIYFDVGASPQMRLDSTAAGADLEFFTDGRVLDGTTNSTDGSIAFSANGGLIYIANRKGFGIDAQATFRGLG